MDDAATVMHRLVQALEDRDLQALVSCWHRDVETTHLLHPDWSWRGADYYRTVMARIWESSDRGSHRVVCSGVAGDRFFIEAVTEHGDGTLMPCVTIYEVEDGAIRRARVYTDRPHHDGVSMADLVQSLNP